MYVHKVTVVIGVVFSLIGLSNHKNSFTWKGDLAVTTSQVLISVNSIEIV